MNWKPKEYNPPGNIGKRNGKWIVGGKSFDNGGNKSYVGTGDVAMGIKYVWRREYIQWEWRRMEMKNPMGEIRRIEWRDPSRGERIQMISEENKDEILTRHYVPNNT